MRLKELSGRRALDDRVWQPVVGGAKRQPGLLVPIVVVWATTFYRAWRRVGSVPHKREYALWFAFETLFAFGLVVGFAAVVYSH